MKPLSRIRIVLVSTSQRGNIGAAARALKTMGLSQLHLVAPRFDDALTHPEALAFAASASDVLEKARIHATLDEALAGCSWAVAMTARNRDISVPEMDVRSAVTHAIKLTSKLTSDSEDIQAANEVAFVFGSERYGLDNEDLMKCQVCCTLPTSPDYTSLNLAQAVQIIAYECRQTVLASSVQPDKESSSETLQFATLEQREQFFDHLQEALIAIDFLNAEYPKKLMQRLRRLFARTELDQDEINILRGICTAILSGRRN